MATVITKAGEALMARKAQANEQLDIDTFIFANVPGQDPAAPIDRDEGVPPVAKQVHQQQVQQYGRISDNIVVYSTVLSSTTGPFEFNWLGLYSSVNQTLVAIQHVPTVTKTVTAPGVAGNTLNRNFGIEYSGIAELTGINVAPETWQLDFTARLAGMDELTRQLAADMNGRDWFINDGFKVEPRSTLNSFRVLPGVGYVSGLRIELENEHIFNVQSYPQNVYVDAWFDGTAESVWRPNVAFTVSNTEMDDYIDVNGVQHYVFKLAMLNSASDVDDLRNTEGLGGKINVVYEPEVLDFNFAMPWRRLEDYEIETATWAFLLTGQSLAGGGVGNDATPEVKPPAYPDNIMMLSPQPVIDGLAYMGSTLLPLEETSRVTIAASWMQGVHEKKGVDCIFTGQAYGGQPYNAIKKGGSTGIYERCLQQITDVMNAKPQTQYQAVAIIHGEQDGINNNQAYDEDLIEWANNFNSDINAICNTTKQYQVFICQTATAGGYNFNGGIDEMTFPTPLLQLKAHQNSNLINLVCPKYHLPYYDHSHLTNKGQVRLGEYYEKAMLKLKDSGNWSPLMPSMIELDGNQITITFAGAVGALTFDESLVKPIANYGFQYRDDGDNSINSVAINASNQVVITLSGVSTNPVIAYGYHNGAGGGANQVAGYGDRGNLRDSDPTQSKYSTDKLYNWCVMFREAI
ncbi:phage tail-collar fiber domain-containing protein [Shewanella algae]|uniref:phage tail-collar fiber domain-containing protein n=1 Tax=Shewanella algae TaxID=38313 RepID=UPI001AAFF5E0|nr:phage tail protein [Shewanella algae]MBO2695817.1 phage tail protein [Shewanella algae]